jgi:hypothetical protein
MCRFPKGITRKEREMSTRLFGEPTTEQWNEVERLSTSYFRKFGVRPEVPNYLTNQQPTLAAVQAYIDTLEVLIGLVRSSHKQFFTVHEQTINQRILRAKRWADLYQQVHGPCSITIISVSDDIEEEIRHLTERLQETERKEK